uniref:Reverse transcriptase domain-containing protein n=1 Tax=Tanacetum cinerariifolium TaxID=118510 RepID=A0A6L2LQ25_TANCI|nr:hypothetical protein [Tanacetum cinerariifolium]
MILRDGDERLTLNMRHDTSSYSNQPQRESINMFNIFNDSSEDFLEDLFLTNQPSGNPTFSSHPELTSPKVKDDIFDPEGGNVISEKLLDLVPTKDLHPPLHVNPLSGNTTYSSSPNQLLEMFTDEHALDYSSPSLYDEYDDDLQFDIESDLKEIEFLLHQNIDSSLNDSIDQSNLANATDNFVDSMPEMFTDEHALDYSSPPIFDEYDDDFLEFESDAENVYDDPFDSKGEKIKESKLLIDELDLPCDFLPTEYDSFICQDFSRVEAKPSTNNEDKVFNPGILIQKKPFEIITRVVQDKKLATSNTSLVLEDFDPPFYEPLFFKEVPNSNMLLYFHLKIRKKFSNQGYTLLKKFILLYSWKFEDSFRRILSSSLHFLSFIRESCSRDRPPMLAPRRYPQWRSRFLRYVDTRPNGEALRKCILSGPYKPSTVLVHVVEATENSPLVAEHTTLETPANMSPENKAHFLAEKEAIHLILNGIGDDIYSTVDACQTA